jgi:WhiB family redox-sensing transcriptional regulator
VTTAGTYYAAEAGHGELDDVNRDGRCRGGGLVSGVPERWRRADEPWTARLSTRGQWRSAAACRSADPELFFPISDSGPAQEQTAKAKAICATCQVRRECLAFALRTGQPYGIWAGTTEHERAAVRRRAASEPPVPTERRPVSRATG